MFHFWHSEFDLRPKSHCSVHFIHTSQELRLAYEFNLAEAQHSLIQYSTLFFGRIYPLRAAVNP